jgi:hypothetical protein
VCQWPHENLRSHPREAHRRFSTLPTAVSTPASVRPRFGIAKNRDDPRRASSFYDCRLDRTSVMEHKKRGRPSKGDRRPVITRLPRALADAAQEHAARQGMSFNDFVGLLLSREVGVPYSDQEALSLSA